MPFTTDAVVFISHFDVKPGQARYLAPEQRVKVW